MPTNYNKVGKKMENFKFPYNKYNEKTAEDRDYDSKMESVMTTLTVSQLIDLLDDYRYVKYIPDVAFKKLPSELIEAARRPDIEKRLFFTHSDPFFSAGVLLRYCCFKSEIHLSQFISMFLNEFERVDSIEFTKRQARLVIGAISSLSTYNTIPEFWDLKNTIQYSTVTTGRAPDVLAELDDNGTEYYKYVINLELWTEFASEWDILSGMEPEDWTNEKTAKIVNDFLLCLLEYVEGNKMYHIFVSTIVSAQSQHASSGKRCECAACINMLNTFLVLQKGPKHKRSSGNIISRSSQSDQLGIPLGYWPKEVYLRILPFLYVEPRWKLIIEQLYENDSIDMASFMDNLFLDHFKSILSQHPFLMRDVVLALLRDDQSDSDRTVYEQAARDIILFSVMQSSISNFSDALCAIKMNMCAEFKGFFETLLEQISNLRHSSSETIASSSNEPETYDSVSSATPSYHIMDSFIEEIEKVTQGDGRNFVDLDSSFIDRLLEASQVCDIDDSLLFTEQDVFFMAVDIDIWSTFQDEWKILTTVLHPPFSPKHGIIRHWAAYKLSGEMRKASQFLSRIIALAEARYPELSSQLITSLMVANLQSGVEPNHCCFDEQCRQCGSLMSTFQILMEHYLPDLESIPVRVYHSERSPRVFAMGTIDEESMEAKVEAYAEWYGIVSNLYEDGRIYMGSFIYNMFLDSYDLYPLLCTRPNSLLFEYIVKMESVQNDPLSYTTILFESLQWALVIVQNPSKFKWIGEGVDHPTVGTLFSMYSALFDSLYDILRPNHMFFANLGANIDSFYTYFYGPGFKRSCVPFISMFSNRECVREFFNSQMDLRGITRARKMNRA